MATISARRVAGYVATGQEDGTTTERGRALEDLVCYVFGRVPGISVTHRNQLNTFRTEEIDVALWNEKRAGGFDFLPNIVLIEAKNWSSPVSSAELAWFDRKLVDRGLDFGVLVAINGVTGNAEERTAAHQIVASSLRDSRRLVILTGADLLALRDTRELVLLIKTRLCELAVAGTVFP